MSDFAAGVLVDKSGRRRRVLRLMGRAVSVLLLIWLGVLALAWLGIEPLGNLGFLDLGKSRATPPALPARIQSAVTGGRVVAPRRSVAVGGRPTPAGARSGRGSEPQRNIRHHPVPASNAKPVHKHLPARGSIPGRTVTTPSSAHARAPVRSPKNSPQTPGAANPGKSTTSPGHTKEPGQTSAQPAPASHGTTSANGKAVGTPHNRTTTSPLP
jgi:hypothetical protein